MFEVIINIKFRLLSKRKLFRLSTEKYPVKIVIVDYSYSYEYLLTKNFMKKIYHYVNIKLTSKSSDIKFTLIKGINPLYNMTLNDILTTSVKII